MKQRLSVGALALQLTWKPVLLVCLAVAGIQMWSFGQSADWYYAFADRVGKAFPLPGKLGFAALLILLILSGCEFRGAKFNYTLRRLGIQERDVTLIWAAVFTGWFFLYWMTQLGLIFGCYAWYSNGQELEPTALFMASWIEEYFHLLFPLAEQWGYIRNVVMCIGFGCNAAFAAHQIRHKGSAWAPVSLVLVYSILAQGELAEWIADITLILYTILQVILFWVMLRKGEENEEN